MSTEKHTKKIYNEFGKEYQMSRKRNDPKRAFNEFLEVPAMVKAIANIKGKKLLDIGCGAGVHIKRYLKKGAKAEGIDLSETMINLAKNNCPLVKFKTGSITKLPYKSSTFDIATASLVVDYVDNLEKAFKEVARVLKKGGMFYYSNTSSIFMALEKFENKNIEVEGAGIFTDKRTGEKIFLGQAWNERMVEFEMVPGMMTKAYFRTFRSQLKALVKNGFELVDLINCKPTASFKKYSPEEYEIYTKIPSFNIYVARKKWN